MNSPMPRLFLHVLLLICSLQLRCAHCQLRDEIGRKSESGADAGKQPSKLRIAIVGAGIGGSAASYYVREELSKQLDLPGDAVEIHVFEKSERACGRMRTAVLDGQSFEIGAAVAHPKNQYMSELLFAADLEKLPASTGEFGLVPRPGAYVSLGNGAHPWSEDLALLLRYGRYVVELDVLLELLFDEFTHVYALQAQRQAFDTVGGLLAELPGNFTALGAQAFGDYLNASGMPDQLIDELVSATVNAVYNQDARHVTALAGMTALARSANDRYWSVLGGNERLCGGLLDVSNATLHLGTAVTAIAYVDNSTVVVSWTTADGAAATTSSSSSSSSSSSDEFDFVIVATPLNGTGGDGDIAFSGFPQPLPVLAQGVGQRTTTTLVKGDINLTYFGLDNNNDDDDDRSNSTMTSSLAEATAPWLFAMPSGNGVLATVIENTPPVDGSFASGKPVWKVQSTDPLPADFLSTVFPEQQRPAGANATVVQHTFEFAYPHFRSSTTPATSPLRLTQRVLYSSDIEWGAASAMEMSCISAKNAALLLAEELRAGGT